MAVAAKTYLINFKEVCSSLLSCDSDFLSWPLRTPKLTQHGLQEIAIPHLEAACYNSINYSLVHCTWHSARLNTTAVGPRISAHKVAGHFPYAHCRFSGKGYLARVGPWHF
jgi:hypothetical protein